MNDIVHEINEYRIPTYMEEILTNNYCPNFLKMSMLRENNDYVFNYQTDRFQRIDISSLTTCLKLCLLRTIISLGERNTEWLIKADNYLLEPELIYSYNNSVSEGNVRLLFYPDSNRISFDRKLAAFAEKIKNKRDRKENELLDQFKNYVENCELNKARMFLDKNIMRMELANDNKAM